MIARVAAFLLASTVSVAAQGFSGLGAKVEGFSIPAPNYSFQFPKDHGAHPDFRIEWWYLTANLKDVQNNPYGVQWTLFRTALAPETKTGWGDPQIWFAHAAVTTPDHHLVAERTARGGIGQAGVELEPFTAWIDDWQLSGPSFEDMQITARGADFVYDLSLAAAGPFIFHGQNGFSVKSDQGQASYYYSQPKFLVSGSISLPDGNVQVEGSAWLDREWSSQPLSETQSGWDWFSLSFETGEQLMGFLLHEEDGAAFSSATWISANGESTSYPNGAFSATPLHVHDLDGRNIPTEWSVKLPDKHIDVVVSALNPNAWMDVSIPYWEGPVVVNGSHDGHGYLEMTGYD